MTDGGTPVPRKPSAFAVPPWAADVGRWSWVIIAVLIVAAALWALLSAMYVLTMATLFAILFGCTFLTVVDWLAAHHFKRWLAALLVVVFLLALSAGVALIIVYGVVNQIPQIKDNLDAAVASLKKALSTTSVPPETVDTIKSGVTQLLEHAGSGVAGTLASVVSGVGSLFFGAFIGINIMVWLLIQGRPIGGWMSRHMGPVPQPVAYTIFANGARFFRRYIWGSTLIGLFNGVVLLLGALIIGVPMPATIGVVAWFTNYIPYFGAIISGAFAVLIALGAGGPSKAIPMLIVVFLANGYLQTVVSQFALGSALNLHPLAILFATTAGGLLGGAVGAVFAAPLLKIVVDSYGRLRNAGLFGAPPAVALEGGPATRGDPGPPEEGSGGASGEG